MSASETSKQPGQSTKGKKTRSQDALDKFHEEGKITERYDAKMLLRLWPFIRPYSGKLYLSLLFLVINSAIGIARPLLMRGALDAVSTEGGMKELTHAGFLIAGLLVIEQTISFPQMYYMQIAGAQAMADLRALVFRFLHSRSLGFFDRTPVGRLVTRVTNDVDAIGEMFASGALNAVGDLLRLVVIVVLLLGLDFKLSLIAFAAVPPVALGVNWTRRRMREAFREVRTKTARMNAFINEQVSGMSIVQAFAREKRSAEEFDVINDAYRTANNRSIVLDATTDAAIEMVSSVCIAMILWYAGIKAVSETITFGTLFAFVAYIEMFFVPIRDLSARYSLVQSAMAGAERVFELLDNKDEDAPMEEQSASAKLEPGADGPAFELRNVVFEYKPNVPVLRDVSLTVRRGEKIAVVGATGAGKSTLAALLLRLYDVRSGEVRVFGSKVNEVGRAHLRRQFAVVPQDVFLFPGSVASNIAAGEEKPDHARVVSALKRVGALEVFMRREGGLDAQVIERGQNFSAGERQLLAFARALYKDPPILVLDEATANVDSDTELRLQHAVDAAMAGRTALIIAHRLSTIRKADRIVVFHKGRIIEQGTHEELLRLGGVYGKLYRLQFAKSAAVEASPIAAG